MTFIDDIKNKIEENKDNRIFQVITAISVAAAGTIAGKLILDEIRKRRG